MNNANFKEQIFTYQDLQQIFEDRLTENKDIYMKEFDFTKEVEYNTYADSEVQQMFTGFVAGFLLRHSDDFIQQYQQYLIKEKQTWKRKTMILLKLSCNS